MFATQYVKAKDCRHDEVCASRLVMPLDLGVLYPEALEITFSFEPKDKIGGVNVFVILIRSGVSGEYQDRRHLGVHLPFSPADRSGNRSFVMSIPEDIRGDFANPMQEVFIEIAASEVSEKKVVEVVLKEARVLTGR